METANGDHYHARAVLLAIGSSYRRTDADGEDDLISAGVHFCATCDGPFYKGSDELMRSAAAIQMRGSWTGSTAARCEG